MPAINATYTDDVEGAIVFTEAGIRYTRTPGIAPNVNVANLSRTGTPTLTEGSIVVSDGSNSVTLPDQYASEFWDVDDLRYSCQFIDTRWQWQYKRITGEYNKPHRQRTA